MTTNLTNAEINKQGVKLLLDWLNTQEQYWQLGYSLYGTGIDMTHKAAQQEGAGASFDTDTVLGEWIQAAGDDSQRQCRQLYAFLLVGKVLAEDGGNG